MNLTEEMRSLLQKLDEYPDSPASLNVPDRPPSPYDPTTNMNLGRKGSHVVKSSQAREQEEVASGFQAAINWLDNAEEIDDDTRELFLRGAHQIVAKLSTS